MRIKASREKKIISYSVTKTYLDETKVSEAEWKRL